jgi:hypothetical protein
MANKTTLYRPLRITVLHSANPDGLADLAINPTVVQSVNPAGMWKHPTATLEREISRIVLKDHDAKDLFVLGSPRGVIEAWESAMRGGPLTPAEWGCPPVVDVAPTPGVPVM